MKTVFYSAPFKFFTVLLASLFLLGTVLSGGITVLAEIEDIFDENYKTYAQYSAENEAEGKLYHVITEYLSENPISFSDPNFVFRITDRSGAVLKDTGAENAALSVSSVFVSPKDADRGRGYFLNERGFDPDEYPEETYDVHYVRGGFLAASERVKQIEKAEARLDRLRARKEELPVLAGCGLILTAGFSVLICLIAGRRKEDETVRLNAADRIPLDVAAVILAGVGAFLLLLWDAVRFETVYLSPMRFLLTGVLLEIAGLAVFWLLYTLAARIKAGTVLKNTALYRLFSLLRRGCKAAGRFAVSLFRAIPTVPGVAAVMGFLAVCNIILGLLSRDGGVFVLLVLEWIALFVCGILIALGFSYLQKKTKAMARGNLWERVEDKYLIGPLKEQAEDLNRIGEGLNAAVNERIKSERMKTELITNVSHDIKTPLTSIINYTDLLSKEENLSETSAEYLKVLQRQSARLKKLTDDIVEASKASSGVLSVNFAPCDLKVLLEQTVGEYEEKTAKADLTVLLTAPERPVTISADGRRLWRIFENLMNNICKYALPSTRVYLTLTTEGDQAVITFRNISKDPLNIDPDELTERFVRGDQSRNTEGSGLGLAIARSLTELQKGTFRIQIDGDLFKVTLTFPLQKQDKPSEE